MESEGALLKYHPKVPSTTPNVAIYGEGRGL